MVTVDGVNYSSSVSSGKLTIAILRGGVRIETWQTCTVVIDITPKVVGSKLSGFRIVPSAKAYVET